MIFGVSDRIKNSSLSVSAAIHVETASSSTMLRVCPLLPQKYAYDMLLARPAGAWMVCTNPFVYSDDNAVVKYCTQLLNDAVPGVNVVGPGDDPCGGIDNKLKYLPYCVFSSYKSVVGSIVPIAFGSFINTLATFKVPYGYLLIE